MKIIKYCVICGKEIRDSNREKTCSRECQRIWQRQYNLIYGNLWRRFNGKG